MKDRKVLPHHVLLPALQCLVEESRSSRHVEPDYRHSLQTAMAAILDLLGFYRRENDRADILRAVNELKKVVLIDPAFDSLIVETLNLLAEEPSSDPSVRLLRKVSSAPPPPPPSIGLTRAALSSEEDL